MDSPPPRPVTALRKPRASGKGRSDASQTASTSHAPARASLRLLVRADNQLRREVDGLQAAFASSQHELLDWLARVETALDSYTADAARAAMEELSFIRVGLRCIADAVGELDANVSALQRPLPDEDASA